MFGSLYFAFLSRQSEDWAIYTFQDQVPFGTGGPTINVSEFTHSPCEIKFKTLLHGSISQGKFMRSPRPGGAKFKIVY